MATLLNPFIRALDANGDAVSGGQLAVFEAGTTTPVTTYSDRELTTAQAQPLIANSAGEFAQSFVASGIYKIRVSDADGVTLYENDNVRISDRPDDPVFFDTYADLIASEDTYAEGTFVIALRESRTLEAAASGATDHNATNAGGQKFYYRPTRYETASELIASTEPARGEGAFWMAGPFLYVEAAPDATDHDVVNAASTPVKLYVLPGDDGAYNVVAFGAVSDGVDPDTGADNAAVFQKAIDKGGAVKIPKGNYRCSTVTISGSGQRIYGDGMGQTYIHPMDTYSCFIVASDNIEISDLEFRGKTGTGQADALGDCIKFDAVTNDASFTRHMEGCKVERVKFRNLKMNGIYVPHLLRESHIRECRFVGMGDAASDRSAIKMHPQLGNTSDCNNIWIEGNQFYRFENPPINLKRSTLVDPVSSQVSYADIWILNNLIHGQLYDEAAAVETVQPGECDHITIQDGTLIFCHFNHFTSIHPEYHGIRIICGGTVSKNADVSHNSFGVRGTVGGVSYTRAGGTATGHAVYMLGLEAQQITNNHVNGGTFVSEFFLSNGAYTSTIDVCVQGNVSEAGAIVADYAGLGTWRGRIDVTDDCITQDAQTINGTVDVVADGVSTFRRTSSALALRFDYDGSTSGAFVGSPAANSIQISTAGGSALQVVNASGTRPGADASYQLGLAAFRWTNIHATNGTIQTSDRRQKQDIEELSEAEKRVARRLKGLIRKFRWNDAVSEKGADARIHVGVIAQDVLAAFEAEGLDGHRYGVICYDEWEDYYEDVYQERPVLNLDGTDAGKTELVKVGSQVTRKAGNSYAVRYDQLLAFIISAV